MRQETSTKPAPAPAAGDRRALAAVGVSGDPHALLLTGELDFHPTDRVAIGPLLQAGFDDDVVLLAPSFHAKFLFLPDRIQSEIGARGARIVPFVQAGAGLVYLEKERRVGDDEDVGPLLHAGGGIEFRFDERVSLGSTVLLGFLPGGVLGEHSLWTWRVLEFGIAF